MIPKSAIADLELNLAWQEICARVDKMLEQADKDIENPDPFEHGKGVGARQRLREIKGLPDELKRIVDGGGTPVTKLR